MGRAAAQTDLVAQHPELRILVVDDDVPARQIIADYLASFGITDIVQAGDGSEAFQQVQNTDVDVIISDWEMPHINGIEFLRALKLHPAHKKIPFIMSTSPISQEQEKVQQAMLAHVDAYLIKPFRADTLRAKLNQVLLKIYGDEARPALLADDDESVREIVRDLLKSMKFDPIFEARDGVQAYHLLEQHYEDIALVVSDWEMPKMEGIELLRRLRSNPVYAEIPFLMITSQTSIEHIKVNLAIKAEVDHYLMKPFTLEDFREKVAVVLKRGHRAKRIKRRLAEAHQLMKDGDLESARLMYSHVLNLDPRAVEAYLGLANIKRTQSSGGAFEEVVALIRDAIEIAPNWDRSYIELAHVYEAEKSLDRAIAILKEAIIPCPMSHLIHYELGRLLYKRGRGQPAIEELEKAIRIRPDHSDAGELLKLIKESK